MDFTSGLELAIIIILGLAILLGLAISVFSVIVMWRIFKKANKEGWYSLIPFYNLVVLLEIIGFKWYYIFFYCLSFVPIIGSLLILLYNIIVSIKFSKSFGKDVAFGIGIAFLPLIFEAIIAFDRSIEYTGPVVDGDIDFHNLF